MDAAVCESVQRSDQANEASEDIIACWTTSLVTYRVPDHA